MGFWDDFQTSDNNNIKDVSQLFNFKTPDTTPSPTSQIQGPPISAMQKPIQKPNTFQSIFNGLHSGIDLASKAVVDIPKALLSIGPGIQKLITGQDASSQGGLLGPVNDYSNYLGQQSQQAIAKNANASKINQILGKGAEMIPQAAEMAMELGMPVGKLGTVGKVLEKGAEPVTNLSLKLGESIPAKIAQSGIKTGAEMGLYGGLKTGLTGGNTNDILNSAKDNAIGGALFGAGGKAIGEIAPRLLDAPINKDNAIADALKQYFGEPNNNLNVDRTATSQLALPAPKEVPQRILPTLKDGVNDLGSSENTILAGGSKDIYSIPKTEYTVKNTALEDAQQKYDDAIQTIQNRFGHYQLIPEEIPLIKSELGIDINKLADNLATAKTNVSSIGDRQRLGTVAGVNDLTGMKLKQSYTNPVLTRTEKVNLDPNQKNWLGEGKSTTNTLSLKEQAQLQNDIAKNTPQLNPLDANSHVNDIRDTNTPIQSNLLTGEGNKVMAAKMKTSSPDVLTGEVPTEPVKPRDTSNNKYVNPKDMELNIGNTDKATAADIRQAVSGMRDSQTVAGIQLKKEMQKLAPNEQEGIQLFIDAGGDKTHLKEMANNMDNVDSKGVDSIMDSYVPNSNKVTYRDAYNQALNLSPNAMKAVEMAQKYYKESGDVAFNLGTTHSIVDNYANRMWNTKKGNVQTEAWDNGLSTSTNHAKARSLNNIGEGLLQGMEPSTLNAGDALSIHNQEMGRVNTNMKLANAMKEKGIGSFSKEGVPDGFTAIDSLSKKIPTKDGMLTQPYVVPSGIAEGLKALTEPNKMWDKLRGIQKYQGVVKTVDLAFSAFHHITLAAQMLYNNKGGIDMFRHMKDFTKLDSPDFNAMEKDFVSHTGQTTSVAGNLDTLGKLSGDTSLVDKMTNIPVLKQLKQVSDANTNMLFDKMQRWLKVVDYNNKVLDYVSKNPQTDNIKLTQVKRSLAQEINNAYGGLNWDALGVTKTSRAYQGLAFLAPDWTNSSIRMATHASGLGKIDSTQGLLKNIGNVVKGDAGVNAARVQTLVGMGGAALLTEGLNHMLTGHFTNLNPRGHELDVEIQPGVYINMFRSGIGDASKLIANVAKTDPLTGAMQSINSKLAPLPRTLIGQLTNKQFNGASITNAKDSMLQNTLTRVGEGIGTFAPIPFGVSNTLKYNSSGQQTPLGTALVSTGAGTYSKDKTNPNDPTSSYQGNWLNKYFNPDANQKVLNSISDFKSQKLKDSKATNQQIQNQLKGGTIPTVGTPQQIKAQQKQLTKFKQTPTQQSFGSMSKAQQLAYLKQYPEQTSQLSKYLKLK